MSSGFITESEASEIRKRRQEEWERVRKPSDPLERPEDPYDSRSLYDRLQEQKQKRDLEYEEAHKLKNMIKGLDDDEVEFLDLVDRTKIEADRKKEIEEEKELNDYRNRVAILQEKSIDKRLQAEVVVSKPKCSGSKNLNQQKLLKGAVIKRAESGKRKMEPSNNSNDKDDSEKNPKQQKTVSDRGDTTHRSDTVQSVETPQVGVPSAFKCVAVLPGLGYYSDASSDETNSDSDSSEIEKASTSDLLGRRLSKKSALQVPHK
ncbi:PSME3-interacting protein [Euwallacea similis]|uniref:PSME3-interacting protein n=1 Tax=Euwallacea similis TaxID=1736056 RepID=UPI00344E531D